METNFNNNHDNYSPTNYINQYNLMYVSENTPINPTSTSTTAGSG